MKSKFLSYLSALTFILLTNLLWAQDCTINAGGNQTICGTVAILNGNSGENTNGNPVWTLISKPSGAPNPIISTPNSYTSNVTGMTFPGNYVFQISQTCTSGTATSQVTIIAPGVVTSFTAGPDRTTIAATTGVSTLNATIPAGYTPSWTFYNLNSYEYNGTIVTTNATMTGANTATPTLTLTKKADHDIDPVYRAVLKITSINNPSCWYEDDVIVRFRPNPNVSYPTSRNFCGSQSAATNFRYFYDPNSTSPNFSDDTINASANSSFGTTITMNIISQPAGGNLAYDRMRNGRIFFASNFNQTVGAYVFTITISNATGTYTTPHLTFNYYGSDPEPLSFVDAAYPEQMALYSPGNSAGAVYCNRVGTTTPIRIQFKINPVNSSTLTSSVSAVGTIPTGGAPSILISGAGTLNRTATLTPPTGGWRVGTYKFSVSVSNGICTRSHIYYVHISDGNRANVNVNNITLCYSGTGSTSATIPLPAIYKGVVNPSYFQDYSGRYDFTVVSKPTGAANPVFDAANSRTFTNTSTVIGNLNMHGEYVFKITATPPSGGDPGFIAKEYACSGTSYEDTFSIFVSQQINANAGNDFSSCTSTTLNGNNPGATSTGVWTLVSKPAGAADPIITNSTLYNSAISNFSTSGDYILRWTVKTGSCTSFDDVKITADCNNLCDKRIFLSQSPNNTTPTTLYNVNYGVNPFIYPVIGTDGSTLYNAIGLNPKDGFLYGLKNDNTKTLLKINSNTGAIQVLGAVTGALPSTNFINGEVDDQGNYYVATSSYNTIYKINLATRVSVAITLNNTISSADFAYNKKNGLLYAVAALPGFGNQLYSINPITGVVGSVGSPHTPGVVFGGMIGDSNGKIFGISNGGGFYQFNLITGEKTLISVANSSAFNDAAHCVNSPILFNLDLKVTKTNGQTSYTPGSTVTYTITAENLGPFGVVDANVKDLVPTGIPAANMSYTAVASTGSSTSVLGTLTGGINDIVSLPVGGLITYTVNVNIPFSFTGNLINSVTIDVPEGNIDTNLSNNTAIDEDVYGVCFRDPISLGVGGTDTKVGITLLKRAGSENADNWPMTRKGGHIALESNTQGFVPTRISKANLGNITNPQDGMMVYDTTDKCLKIYDGSVWKCFSLPSCP